MGEGGYYGKGHTASIHYLIWLRSLQCGGALGQYRSRESKVAIPTDQRRCKRVTWQWMNSDRSVFSYLASDENGSDFNKHETGRLLCYIVRCSKGALVEVRSSPHEHNYGGHHGQAQKQYLGITY